MLRDVTILINVLVLNKKIINIWMELLQTQIYIH